MQSTAKWTEFPKYPVIAGTMLLATLATAAWWSHFNVSMLMEGPETQRGELWRLFTSVFLHVDILHLLFNLYWLWIFGTTVERAFGHARTALIVVFLAVGSGAFQFALDRGGVGLSGVGYGLFGLLWVLSRHDDRFRGLVGPNITTLFAGWFLLCVVTTLNKIYSVGNVAHAAGAVLGVLLGYAIVKVQNRLAIAGVSAALVICGCSGATITRPWVNVSHFAGYDEGWLGYQALLKQDNVAALHWLKDAARLQPDEPHIWYNLGIAYARQGDSTSAKDAYKRAHDLNPQNADFAKALADTE
jgi:membrane associated rhomboid family serine protease